MSSLTAVHVVKDASGSTTGTTAKYATLDGRVGLLFSPVPKNQTNETKFEVVLKWANNAISKPIPVSLLKPAEVDDWVGAIQLAREQVSAATTAASNSGGGGSYLMGRTSGWVPDSETQGCMCCSTTFSIFKRRHHCRLCGQVVCAKCSPKRALRRGPKTRVCITCLKENTHEALLEEDDDDEAFLIVSRADADEIGDGGGDDGGGDDGGDVGGGVNDAKGAKGAKGPTPPAFLSQPQLRSHRRPQQAPAADAGAAPPPLRPPQAATMACPIRAVSAEFLSKLGVDDVYLNSAFDRCYCKRCYTGWETIDDEGPTPYVVPEPGWVRFGLHVGPRAHSKKLDIFHKWSACFHGVKSPLVLNSILDCGALMKPGDTLVDGTGLESTKCAGRQDEVVYTSPTIKYAGLKFYAEPVKFTTAAGEEMRGSIAVQCRQNPATIKKQGETMAFARKRPEHLAAHCPNVDLAELEWKTKANNAVIPYGVVVRVWPKGKDPAADAYSSPVDGGKWWAHEQ